MGQGVRGCARLASAASCLELLLLLLFLVLFFKRKR